MIKLVQLTPLGEYFFGGEITFGENNASYYARSQPMPQQTSLLGLMRHELLKASGNAVFFQDKVVDSTKASELIGSESFNGSLQNFGIIQGLSPVFLMKKYVPFIFGPQETIKKHDIQLSTTNALITSIKSLDLLKGKEIKESGVLLETKQSETEKEIKESETENDESGVLLETKESETEKETKESKIEKPIFKAYDGKSALERLIVSPDGKETHAFEDVFKTMSKTGNRKNYTGATDDKGFFKMDMFRLEKDFSFAFLVSFTKDPQLKQQSTITFGAEQRPFKMEIKDSPFPEIVFTEKQNGVNIFPTFNNFENLFFLENKNENFDFEKIILLSDAKVETEINNFCDFAITSTTSFRNLKTQLHHPNKNWKAINSKSHKSNLLKQGSVLNAKDISRIETELHKKIAWRRIGYNYFKTISKKTKT